MCMNKCAFGLEESPEFSSHSRLKVLSCARFLSRNHCLSCCPPNLPRFFLPAPFPFLFSMPPTPITETSPKWDICCFCLPVILLLIEERTGPVKASGESETHAGGTVAGQKSWFIPGAAACEDSARPCWWPSLLPHGRTSLEEEANREGNGAKRRRERARGSGNARACPDGRARALGSRRDLKPHLP